MFSVRSLFQEILDKDESYRLFCSIAAGGEAQGGWENGRIAALAPESQRALAPRIARHGADEDKHGRIFGALLKKRGLRPVEIPPETDYTMLLERRGIGLAHERLARREPLTERDIITYLAHSRVTEQRASEQMALLRRHFADHPDIGRAVRAIADDEDSHLAYCHEELLRFARAGHGRTIQRVLRAYALAEIEVYRDVGLAVMEHMGRVLGWSRARAGVLAAGIHLMYAYERLVGWRRMVSLEQPERRDALSGPARREAEFV
ncbi:ferritin-like domain-containing protein [Streptomyces sp. NPDC052042]|uniref:ferritin-like domain-containing protein n=1 Tax=Streptomyces sp. NPDC052042 TaxID=3365683 RepID=UPI0037D55B15